MCSESLDVAKISYKQMEERKRVFPIDLGSDVLWMSEVIALPSDKISRWQSLAAGYSSSIQDHRSRRSGVLKIRSVYPKCPRSPIFLG